MTNTKVRYFAASCGRGKFSLNALFHVEFPELYLIQFSEYSDLFIQNIYIYCLFIYFVNFFGVLLEYLWIILVVDSGEIDNSNYFPF